MASPFRTSGPTFDEAAQLTLPADVEITWDDGTTSRLAVLAERSTSPGHVAALASVRLAVATEDTRQVARAMFQVGGERWTVVF